MKNHEEVSRDYGLREKPKKTQKSPLDDRLGTRTRSKKRLIRCEECGKRFRYEKCLFNHREVMHSLRIDSKRRRDLLCSFSDMQRRKRSKRVSRYKKIPVSASSSFTNFPVSSEDNGELLEVAESLILLSKSGEALISNPLREFEGGFLVGKFTDGSLRSKLVGISTDSDGISKELLGFLGDKKAMKNDESGQLKWVGAEAGLERVSLEEDRSGLMLQNAKTEQKLGGQETDSGDEGFQMNTAHRCRLCDRVFSSYQALGGHQTFHRTRSKSVKVKARDADEKNQ